MRVQARCTIAWLMMSLAAARLCWADQRKGVVACYSFEEGPGQAVKDWSGNGNEGKILGAKYVALGTGRGFALRLDSGEAYVDCGDGASLDLEGAVAVELWLYPQTISPGAEAGLVGKGFSSYVLTYTNGNCWWYINSTQNAVSARVPSKSWHHVAATFDGNDLRIYTDGELVSTLPSRHPRINADSSHFFLRYPMLYGEKADPPFTCMMDDVRVYNRALSAEEVLSHYLAGRNLHLGVRPGRMSLTPHFYAALSRLRVEVDFVGLQPTPSGTILVVELLEPVTRQVKGQYRTAELWKWGKLDAVFGTKNLPPRDYEVRARAMDRNGAPVGFPATVTVRLRPAVPAWLQAHKGVKVLNNFVIELLKVNAPPKHRDQQYRIANPRDGWVYLSSTAHVKERGRVRILLDSAAREDAVLLHETGSPKTLEAMRHLSAGEHRLEVRCEGEALLKSLVVRAIPEILYAEIGYQPSSFPVSDASFITQHGPYTMEYLKRIKMLDSLNVIVERDEKPEYAPYLREWRKQGKRVLQYSNLLWMPGWEKAVTADGAYYQYWAGLKGLRDSRYDGIILDEFTASYARQYASQTDGVRRISQNPQVKGRSLYAYCVAQYEADYSKAFAQAIIDAGYKLVEEQYLPEQPTEAAAREYLEVQLKQKMLRYQEAFPGCQKNLIFALGYLSSPPETQNVDPGVDFKVWMEMQFSLLANDPVFFGLYGVMAYHSCLADEEIQRWVARLYRHYCIEGRTERLSHDPYVLPHLRNGDFAHGATGWKLDLAEQGSAFVTRVPGYGNLQGRFQQRGEGDTVLVTRRSAARPNRFSQSVRALTPGRLYSLKMLTADYREFTKGQSVCRKHEVSIRMEGVELLPAKCFEEVFASGACGHSCGPFNRENNLWITYRRLVFRAKSKQGLLAVSDWASDAEPGGPIGQELMHNFVEVQPYLEH